MVDVENQIKILILYKHSKSSLRPHDMVNVVPCPYDTPVPTIFYFKDYIAKVNQQQKHRHFGICDLSACVFCIALALALFRSHSLWTHSYAWGWRIEMKF